MKKYILLIFVAIICFTGFEASASHVAGGEITYKFTGNSNFPYRYEITLVLIRDSRSTLNFPSPPYIDYSNTCGFASGSVIGIAQPGSGLGLKQWSDSQGYNNPYACVDASGSGVDPNLYEIWIYKSTVNLGGKCSEWRFSYDLNARNSAIANLINPSSYDFCIDAILNNSKGPNSSPTFSDPPARSFCTGGTQGLPRPLIWYQRNNEIDGDSTWYSFSQPLGGVSTPIAFASGFSINQPLLTTNGMSWVNQETGVVSLTPTGGQMDAVVKVNIDEYRIDTLTGLWYSVGRISRDVTVPIVTLCAASAGRGLSIDVTERGFSQGSMPADSLHLIYGIDTTFINNTGNPASNVNGVLTYDIPVVQYNCFDSVINLEFDFAFECTSLSPDGTEFRLIGPDSISRPVVGTYSKDCGLNGELEGASTSISLLLHRKLDKDGYYVLQVRKGSDGNVLSNECGYFLESGYTILIKVEGCPTIEYQMENVTVEDDEIIRIDWSVDEDSTNPYIREELFESWDIRRVNNGTEYLIASINDRHARSFYDSTLKPEQLDYESFTYTVQLVQNKTYHTPANYISSIVLQPAVSQVDDRQYEVRFFWNAYNGWDNAEYQLYMTDLNPDTTGINWQTYRQQDSNYFENTYLLDQSDRSQEGLYAFKVEAVDVVNPSNPYTSTSNWVYLENTYEDIPDTTLVTVRAPNTFTPNEDGFNDRFYIAGFNGNKEYSNISLSVYNRWGQLVFQDENFSQRNNEIEGWDGTDMNTGRKLSDGVYYYVLEMFDPGTKTKQDLQGSVTILGSN